MMFLKAFLMAYKIFHDIMINEKRQDTTQLKQYNPFLSIIYNRKSFRKTYIKSTSEVNITFYNC